MRSGGTSGKFLRLAFVSAALLSISLLALAPAAAAVPEARAAAIQDDHLLVPWEREEVLKGRIVLREIPNPGKKGRTFEAVGVLPCGLDEAFSVITDYRRYPEFMPHVKQTAVREAGPSGAIVEIQLDLPLGMTKKYRLQYAARRGDDGFDVTWAMLPWPELPPGQQISDTSGGWRVRRFEAGGLLTFYRFYVDPGHVPLGLTGLAMALAKRSIPGVLEKTRERIRTLFKPERQ
jgi:hypothetical protein